MPIELFSPSLLVNGMPPLSLSRTINMRRWEEEQRGRAMAPIGTVYEVVTYETPGRNEWVSYALLRVNTAERWIAFELHYRSGEHCMHMIHDYLVQNNIQVAVDPQAVMAPEYPISWLSLNGDQGWSIRA